MALVRLTQRVDVFQRLEELSDVQRQRVLDLVALERLTFRALSMTNEVSVEYRRTLLDLQKVRFELGLDEYKGPVAATTVRGASQTTSLPDGTNIQRQVFEAVTTIEQIFNARKIALPPAK